MYKRSYVISKTELAIQLLRPVNLSTLPSSYSTYISSTTGTPFRIDLGSQLISALAQLEKSLFQSCTRINVQSLRRWVVSYVLISDERLEYWLKYMVAMIKYDKESEDEIDSINDGCNSIGRRLGVMFLFDDIFYHVRNMDKATPEGGISIWANLASRMRDDLKIIVAWARESNLIRPQIDSLTDLWRHRGYFNFIYGRDEEEVLRQIFCCGISLAEPTANDSKYISVGTIPISSDRGDNDVDTDKVPVTVNTKKELMDILCGYADDNCGELYLPDKVQESQVIQLVGDDFETRQQHISGLNPKPLNFSNISDDVKSGINNFYSGLLVWDGTSERRYEESGGYFSYEGWTEGFYKKACLVINGLVETNDTTGTKYGVSYSQISDITYERELSRGRRSMLVAKPRLFPPPKEF